ncbi:MAG: GNAT family N-acetyltransferase [Candidatus Saccharibacteria bacterium]
MLELRLASREHAELIASIIQEAYREQTELMKIDPRRYPTYAGFETADRVRLRLGTGDHAILAYQDDEAVGTISYQIMPDRPQIGYIKRFGILPQYRSHGYGKILVERVEHELRALGATQAGISIIASSFRLQNYYEQMGYKVCERKSVPTLPFDVVYMDKAIGV